MTLRWILHNKILHRDEWKTGEPEVVKLEKRLSGRLAVDVGSNKGVHSKILRQRFNRVVTVDPNPKWKAEIQAALSDHEGKAMFNIGNGLGSADSLQSNPHVLGVDYTNSPGFEVEIRTFDSLELDADLVKIDVEGEELNVLKGMEKHRPKNIIVEIHDERREPELLAMMSDAYQLKRIDASHWWFQRKN